MKVYRLEKCGVGPYQFRDPIDARFNDIHDRLCNAHRDDILHHAWHERPEFRYMYQDCTDYKSACDSVDSLEEWFAEFWDDLIDAGFTVETYETEDYILADRQLVFKP